MFNVMKMKSRKGLKRCFVEVMKIINVIETVLVSQIRNRMDYFLHVQLIKMSD